MEGILEWSDENIEEKIKEITADQLGVEKLTLTLKTSFLTDLDADSLDIVELMMAIEEEFGIEISDEQTERIVTIEDAVNFIKTNI